jgi:hypothetical protein
MDKGEYYVEEHRQLKYQSSGSCGLCIISKPVGGKCKTDEMKILVCMGQ